MSADAVLIFTFSPIQSFIAEARRAADLFTGSAILSELAKASASAIGHNQLVYPASLNADAPNVIVAIVPAVQAQNIANIARAELLKRWKAIADSAYRQFGGLTDPVFDAIWQRQCDHYWEVYWAAATIDEQGYADAYHRARQALDAAKRSRLFDQIEEPGIKDTLSGVREALHQVNQTTYQQVKRFWHSVATGKNLSPAKLRPEGRERLDAIGAIKRFCDIASKQFPSVSTVAALDFIQRAKQQARDPLGKHRQAVEKLLGQHAYFPSSDPDWPFDGDLLYIETLTPQRLEDSYGLKQPDAQKLANAREHLTALYKAVNDTPSTYYAVLALDGDSMGERISACLKQPDPQQAHRQLSESLAHFAAEVSRVFSNASECLIYNGGDDVLAFLPLSWALTKAGELAQAFVDVAKNKAPTLGTASAGIAIVHHLHPLDAALRAARDAEKHAKRVDGKNTLCVTALKRSGEQETARVKWDGLPTVMQLIDLLQSGDLSSRFVGDAVPSLRAIPVLEPEMLKNELRRQIHHHRDEARLSPSDVNSLAQSLTDWTLSLPEHIEELRRWLGIIRFIVRETREEAS